MLYAIDMGQIIINRGM